MKLEHGEAETGLTYQTDFNLSETMENGFQFKSYVDEIDITPAGMIEVEFDEDGKLTAYNLFDTIPTEKDIDKAEFTLTLEEIEPLVKEQLQLVNFPFDVERNALYLFMRWKKYLYQWTDPAAFHIWITND